MKKSYTVYESLKGRKHYLVFPRSTGEWAIDYEKLIKAAGRYFRCSEKNLEIENGWILKDELYFENPGKGAKVVDVVSHWRRK